ncbi:MAG: hypothetical protein CL823_01795 [Crocinitomicaceae bacterium]|nr:hypothetical protein [Crocinitomicaceae bacterium]|tara:strand:- start:1007 stop:1552 length:546 start_codon:yes stop_codon:yes gene_type:complete
MNIERTATIALLALTGYGLYYGYMMSTEKKTESVFTVPHDQNINTKNIVVSLDGSASFDEDGDELDYKWSINPDTELSSEDSVLTSFAAEPGEYTLKLTITDSYGASTSTEHRVVVNEEPNKTPEADITADLGSEEDLTALEVEVLEPDTITADSNDVDVVINEVEIALTDSTAADTTTAE